MAIEKDARVTVGVDGVDDVARAADRAIAPWERAGKVAGEAFKGFAGAVSSAVQGVVSDLAHVVTVGNSISFANAIQSAHAFEDSTTKIAIAAGRDIRSVGDAFDGLAAKTGVKPEFAEAWSAAVGKVTGDVEQAAQSFEAMQAEAMKNGRSVDEYQQLAEALDRVHMGGGKAKESLGTIRAEADQFGAKAALVEDSFVHLSGVISQMSIKGQEDLGKVGALLSSFGGKNVNQKEREEGLSSTLGFFQANAGQVARRFLGKNEGQFYDENGNLDTIRLAHETQQKLVKRYGREGAIRHAANSLGGRKAATEFINTDFDAIEGAGKIAPSSAAAKALQRYTESDAGKRALDDIKRDKNLRGVVGPDTPAGDANNALSHFSAEHPILGYLGEAVGLHAAGNVVTKAVGAFRAGGKVAASGAKGVAAAGEGAAGEAVEGVKTTVAVEMMPIVSGALQDVLGWVKENRDQVKAWGQAAAKWIGTEAKPAIIDLVKHAKELGEKVAGWIETFGGFVKVGERVVEVWAAWKALQLVGGVADLAGKFGEAAKAASVYASTAKEAAAAEKALAGAGGVPTVAGGAAAGKALGAAASAQMVAGAAMAGYAIGKAGDDYFGISDWLSGTRNKGPLAVSDSKVGQAADDDYLASRGDQRERLTAVKAQNQAQRARIAEYERAGLTADVRAKLVAGVTDTGQARAILDAELATRKVLAQNGRAPDGAAVPRAADAAPAPVNFNGMELHLHVDGDGGTITPESARKAAQHFHEQVRAVIAEDAKTNRRRGLH